MRSDKWRVYKTADGWMVHPPVELQISGWRTKAFRSHDRAWKYVEACSRVTQALGIVLKGTHG